MDASKSNATKEFDSILDGLRSKNDDERLRNALTLKNFIFDGGAGGGSTSISSLEGISNSNENKSGLTDSFIYNKLHEYTISKDASVRINTYYSIKSFLELVAGPELETSRFVRLLYQLMSMPEISKQVADTLGSLFKPGWSLIGDFFKFTVGNATENLSNKMDSTKINSILTLQSLTVYNPGALYPYIQNFLPKLSINLKDSNLTIRKESSILLERCLAIIFTREQTTHNFTPFYNEAVNNLKSSSTETVHAAFLIFKVILKGVILYNVTTQDDSEVLSGRDALFNDMIDNIYTNSWQFKEHKSSTVRTEIIEIFPLIAKANSKLFVYKYLQNIIDYYLSRLKKDKDRISTLILFGNLSPVIGSASCLIYAKPLIMIIENLLHSINQNNNNDISKESQGPSSSNIKNSKLTQTAEALLKLNLNNYSSFNPNTQIQASSNNRKSKIYRLSHNFADNNDIDNNDNIDSDDSFFSYTNKDNKSSPNDEFEIYALSDYKGLKRYDFEKAIFFVIVKLCETLKNKITQVLTLNLFDLLICNCNITTHLQVLLSKLIEFYPNLEGFILQRALNRISLLLAGCEFMEPGVLINNLNLSDKDKRRLIQQSVIGVYYDESTQRVYVNGNGGNHTFNNEFLNNAKKAEINISLKRSMTSTNINDDTPGFDSRTNDFKKKINIYKQAYSISTAPLSNYHTKDLNASFNNFTAAHEAHSSPNYIIPSSGKLSDKDGDIRAHFISINDLLDLNNAKKYRASILKNYGFQLGGSSNNKNSSAVLQAWSKLTGTSDNYYYEKNHSKVASIDNLFSGTDKGIFLISLDFPVDSFEYQEICLMVTCFAFFQKFNFYKYVSLFEFARYATLVYVDYQEPTIHKLAALTTSKLFSEDKILNSIQIGSLICISEVLSKLLLTGVTDPSPQTRLAIFQSLNSKYDPQLAQSDNVRLLLMALNDEDFDVKKAVLNLLGRISDKNPAYIMPALRKILMQYLNDLKYAPTLSSKEKQCTLLTCLVASAEVLTKPHVTAIMDVLVPLLESSNKNSAICSIAISCVGELARVSGENSKYFLNKVVPLILTILKNNSTLISMREKIIAVKSLSQLIRSSGKVVEPYFDYPDLLAEIIKIVSDSNVDADLKGETIKLQGILGAIDPYKASILQNSYKSKSGDIFRSAEYSFFKKNTRHEELINEDMLLNEKKEVNVDFTNASEIAKNWGHDPLGEDFTYGIDINEMLNLTDPSLRIPKLIQFETPTDLLILMQLNPEYRPLNETEDYYLILVANILIKVIKDPLANLQHDIVMAVMVTIFSKIRDKCLRPANLIIKGMLSAIMSYTFPKMTMAFERIDQIVKCIGIHVRSSVPELLNAVNECFNKADKMALIGLVETISKNLKTEFKTHLSMILPLFLEASKNDKTKERVVSRKIIQTFVAFGSSIEEYSSLIIENILSFVEPSSGNLELRRTAIESIGRFTSFINITEFSSRIIHSFLRLLKDESTTNIQLRASIMNSLCALIVQLKSDYFIFLPLVDNVLSSISYSTPAYTKLVHQIIKNENVSFSLPQVYEPEPAYKEDQPMRNIDAKLIKPYWQPYGCKTKVDWVEWLKRLAVELLRNSPSICLSNCWELARSHLPVARELFNAAFACTWCTLNLEYREDLKKALLYALKNAPSSSEVLQSILNLAEFMEHNNTPLSIAKPILSKYSLRHHAFAKALHYKEEEFKEAEFANRVSISMIDSLINMNNSLQQADAGLGMLKIATNFYHFDAKESWFQKLQKWQEALNIYDNKFTEDVVRKGSEVDIDTINGKMSCMHALGKWEELELFAEKNWNNFSNTCKEKVAPLAAAAAWGTEKFDKMDNYIGVMKQDSANKYFYDAILNVHRCNYPNAAEDIRNARELLTGEITSLINESYSRAYDVIVRIQMLSDLEEIMEYKELGDNSPRKKLLRSAWDRRLFYCQRNVDIWQRLLNIRTLVISPKDDISARIKFANLCRKSGRTNLAEKTLISLKESSIHLQGVPGNNNEGASFTNPMLVYSQLKLLWDINEKERAFSTLCSFTYDLSAALCLKADQLVSPEKPKELPCDEMLYDKLRKILCKCFLKQGQWQMHLNSDWTKDKNGEGGVLGSFLIPTILYDDWYKGWHYWALANYEVIASKSLRLGNREDLVTPSPSDTNNESELVKLHAIPAIKGFFKSISLTDTVALQDLLRLLELWYAYGGYPEAATEIEMGINDLSIEIWLQVLPQLFSRLHHPDKVVNFALQKLLIRLAEVHPQALLFPLNVSVRSDKQIGQRAAVHILSNIKSIHPRLVSESEAVVFGLCQVANLLSEKWFHTIETSVQSWQAGYPAWKSVPHMTALYEEPKTTFHEKTFWAVWGNDITRGYGWLLKYKEKYDESRRYDSSLLQSALDSFIPIHTKLSGELQSIKVYYLEYVAPQLLKLGDLELAIPGTYEPGKTIIGIHGFENKVPCLLSKQRPRRFFIKGADGRLYDYLLKGQEDIRQDNMVMQLFGLINKLLENDPESYSRHLNLEPYPTIPLSPKSGLLGWVPNSDTFHVLIGQNRSWKNMAKDLERKAFSAYASKHFDHATSLRRLELFLFSLSVSTGMDIYDVLWLKSRSSEVWLERRTTYVRSLAVSSITGYILGLGDRHPSNIMIHRVTGKVIHIDYGDCFESASLREKWPEQVPFRLTRMTVNGLEASGIEGSFRVVLEHVLRVIRSNKESLLALFDSFAYDPLIKWGFDIPNRPVMMKTGYKPNKEQARDKLLNGKISEVEYDEMLEEDEKALLNARAEYVLKRITDKLNGDDFKRFKKLPVDKQVDQLLKQATDKEGLALHFLGWCPFW